MRDVLNFDPALDPNSIFSPKTDVFGGLEIFEKLKK